MTKIYSILAGALCLFLSGPTQSQTLTPHYNTTFNANVRGYYEYLPQGYNPSGSETYPLIIFLHGMGQTGNGSPGELPSVLNTGLPRLINQGQFPNSFNSAGQTFRFIVIMPQFENWPQPNDVKSVLDMAVANYKVNINRVYVTGLSMGGGATWEFAGTYLSQSNRIAAIVPIAGASWPESSRAYNIAAADIAVWATHNDGDATVPASYTHDYVNHINNAPNPPAVPAKKTIFTSSSHDAWTQTYDPSFKENGLNIYEWMLQYQRNLVVLPVSLSYYKVFKSGISEARIEWATAEEINNHHFTIERSGDGTSFSQIGTITATGSGSSYSFTDPAPINGMNYYRLSQTDLDGSVKYFNVQMLRFSGAHQTISLSPNPVNNILKMKFESDETGIINYRMMNSAGIVMRKWSLQKQGFELSHEMDVSSLAPGLYYIECSLKHTVQVKSFVKN